MLSAKRRPVVCEGVGGRIHARCRLICSMDGGLMAVTADLAKLLDKAYEDKTLAELVDAPVSALSGVSEGDAKLLAEAFNVKTIGGSRAQQILPCRDRAGRLGRKREVTRPARCSTSDGAVASCS
jgi:hypothetical protein